jgi:hypothetical protein
MAVARNAVRNANYSLVANFGPTGVHPEVTPALRSSAAQGLFQPQNFRSLSMIN